VRSAAKRYAVRSATTRRWCDDCGAFLPVTEMKGRYDARLGQMRYECASCQLGEEAAAAALGEGPGTG